MTVTDLIFREEKGAPLTAKDHDENIRRLRDALNAVMALLGVVLKTDGTLKDGAVSSTAVLADRIVTYAKLKDIFMGEMAGTNAYTATISPTISAYVKGQLYILRVPNTNTAAVTLNVNGLGVIPVKKAGGTDLSAGDFVSSGWVFLVYDDTGSARFHLVNSIVLPTPIVAGIVSVGTGADLVTTLGAGDTKIGTHTLTLPAGATKWTWVKTVFTTIIHGAGASTAGIDQFKVKVGADTMGWVSNMSAAGFTVANNDDCSEVVWMAEGAPSAGHDTNASLVIDVYARLSANPLGDVPAKRVMYSVGFYQ